LLNFNDVLEQLTISDSLNPETVYAHWGVDIVASETLVGWEYGREGTKSVLHVVDRGAVAAQVARLVALVE
jgi:hypothetical protein